MAKKPAKSKVVKVKVVEAMPKPDESWRAQDDLRTLRSAAEIGADKARLKRAREEATKQIQALQKVACMDKPSAARHKRLADVKL